MCFVFLKIFVTDEGNFVKTSTAIRNRSKPENMLFLKDGDH